MSLTTSIIQAVRWIKNPFMQYGINFLNPYLKRGGALELHFEDQISCACYTQAKSNEGHPIWTFVIYFDLKTKWNKSPRWYSNVAKPFIYFTSVGYGKVQLQCDQLCIRMACSEKQNFDCSRSKKKKKVCLVSLYYNSFFLSAAYFKETELIIHDKALFV